MTTFENWRTISEYPNYQVSNIGRVMNIKTSRILKTYINRGGHESVILCKKLDVKTNICHRLVAHEFIDNPNNKLYVDHVDRNKLNNDIDNLRWVTHQENMMNKTKANNTTSKYKGVSGDINNWKAHICIKGHQRYLGTFRYENNAARAYNVKALELFGEYANLNNVAEPTQE